MDLVIRIKQRIPTGRLWAGWVDARGAARAYAGVLSGFYGRTARAMYPGARVEVRVKPGRAGGPRTGGVIVSAQGGPEEAYALEVAGKVQAAISDYGQLWAAFCASTDRGTR